MPQVGDFPGFLHGRDGYLGIQCATPVNLDVVVDGTVFNHIIASTGGAYAKPYVPLKPFKGKYLEWALTSEKSVRLFLRDCAFNMKGWAGTQYQDFEPFRDLNRELQK
jgi:hypothetical protein